MSLDLFLSDDDGSMLNQNTPPKTCERKHWVTVLGKMHEDGSLCK